MGTRDNSQKVGFVYTNIYELYKKAKQAKPEMPANTRVFRADEIGNLKVTKFEPRALDKETTCSEAREINGANPFDDLKSNLNRLTELHARLRFMLGELEELVAKKK